jgi:hypothetical protein
MRRLPPGQVCSEQRLTQVHRLSIRQVPKSRWPGLLHELPGKIDHRHKGDDVGAIECELCARGKWSASSNDASCADCPAGAITDKGSATGATTCTACAVGQYSTASKLATPCIGCAAGRYAKATGSALASDCAECAAGPITNTGASEGASICTACAVGKHSSTQQCRLQYARGAWRASTLQTAVRPHVPPAPLVSTKVAKGRAIARQCKACLAGSRTHGPTAVLLLARARAMSACLAWRGSTRQHRTWKSARLVLVRRAQSPTRAMIPARRPAWPAPQGSTRRPRRALATSSAWCIRCAAGSG